MTKYKCLANAPDLFIDFAIIKRGCNYFLNFGPFSINIYCRLCIQLKVKSVCRLSSFRLLISTALTTTSLSLNHFSFFPLRKILVHPRSILTGQKFFLETSLILGPFLESIKKAIKLSEIERANIVQRQSITFTTLYLESATALMTSMVLRAERNSIKKYKLYPLIQTHPQVQIWQMHFSSAFLASEAEEGFLVASASFVDTMLSSLFQCKTRILLR